MLNGGEESSSKEIEIYYVHLGRLLSFIYLSIYSNVFFFFLIPNQKKKMIGAKSKL